MTIPYERFADIAYQRTFTWAPALEGIVFISNAVVQPNLWRLDPSDGSRTALTQFETAAVRTYWLTGAGDIAVVQVDQGNEQPDLYLVQLDASQAPNRLVLPDGHQLLGVGTAGFQPGSRRLALCVRPPGGRTSQVGLFDVDTGSLSPLWTGNGVLLPAAFGGDGTPLVLRGSSSNLASNLYAVSGGGQLRPLTARLGQCVVDTAVSRFPGTTLPVRTDAAHEYTYLAELDTATGALSPLLRGGYDVEHAVRRADGSYLCAVNVDGFSALLAVPAGGGPPEEVPLPGRGVVTELATGDGLVAAGFAAPGHPPDLLLAGPGSRPRWRTAAAGRRSPEPAPAVVPEPVRLGGVPCLVYQPSAVDSAPVLLSFHGGPESQDRPDFAYNGVYQTLLSRGIGVVAVNATGSTGYGRTYRRRIYSDWGGVDVDDVHRVVQALDEQPWCAGGERAAFGVSYGGFLALSVAGRWPEHPFAAVAVVNAPSDLPRLVAEDLPPAWRTFAASWIGGTDQDDRLAERSPVNLLHPGYPRLLLIHGRLDPRIPVAQSTRLAECARRLGIPVELVVADGGHGFTHNDEWRRTFSATTEFLSGALAPADREAAA